MKKILLPALLATFTSMTAALQAEVALALSESQPVEIKQPVDKATQTAEITAPVVTMVDASTQTPETSAPVINQPADISTTPTTASAEVASETQTAQPVIAEQTASVTSPVESTQPITPQPVIPTPVKVATPIPEQTSPAQQTEYVTISITKEEADDMVDKTIHELMDLKCKPNASFKVFATGLIEYLENAPAYHEVCEILRAVKDERNATIIGKKLLSIKAYLPVKTRAFLEKEGPVRCVFTLNKRVKNK